MYYISIEREKGNIFTSKVERVYYSDLGIYAEVSLSWCEISAENGKARGLMLTTQYVKGGCYRIKRSGTTCDGAPVFTLVCLFPAESIVNIETCK